MKENHVAQIVLMGTQVYVMEREHVAIFYLTPALAMAVRENHVEVFVSYREISQGSVIQTKTALRKEDQIVVCVFS